MRLKSKLLFVNVPANEPAGAAEFYSNLFGIELARSLSSEFASYHAPIDEDGIDLNVSQRQRPDEMMTPWFGVEDLDSAIQAVEGAGGRVVAGPFDLPVDDRLYEEYKTDQQREAHSESVERNLGRSVVVVDPGGVPFGLIELTRHAQRHYNFGRHQRELGAQQVRVHERAQRLGKKMEEVEPA